MPETVLDGEAGAGRQDAPVSRHVLELHHPRRPAGAMPVPARNGLPEPKRYVDGGTGYDQFPDQVDE